MAGQWFTSTGAPITGAELDSASIRSEFLLIDEATDKLPTLTGNQGFIVKVNSAGTGLESVNASTILALLTSSTASELNLLDGVTATTAEINLLDGITATTAELNLLDGVTATTAEINLLDGVTATTAELNLLDGVTSGSLNLLSAAGIVEVLDENDMASDSDTAIATQKSIKAYTDSQLVSANSFPGALAAGNTTSGNDVVVSAGDKILTNIIAETTANSGVAVDGVLMKDGSIVVTNINGAPPSSGTSVATLMKYGAL